MKVKVEIQFASLTDEDMASMRSVARALTDDPKSVRVGARAGEGGPTGGLYSRTTPTGAS